MATNNPKTKTRSGGTSNLKKDPESWVTGGEPMTDAQASYLKTLSEETHQERQFTEDLTKAEASRRIDKLRKKTDRLKNAS